MATRDSLINSPATFNIAESAHNSLSVHWSAVFAGVFVTLLVYFMLMSLGVAFGAGSIRDIIQSDGSIQNVAMGAGVWMVASVLIALFIGSYASGRVSGIIATRVGYTQGAVITSLFFLALILQIGQTVGSFTRSVSNITSSVTGSVVPGLVRNPRLMAIVEDRIGDLKLKAPMASVITGVTTRLMRGETQSAQNYLAQQAGLTPAQAQVRMNTIATAFKTTLKEVAERISDATSRLGLAAFVTILLGTLAAMLGGGTGALVNLRKPIDRVDEKALRRVPAYT